jgi:hypothetical protein
MLRQAAAGCGRLRLDGGGTAAADDHRQRPACCRDLDYGAGGVCGSSAAPLATAVYWVSTVTLALPETF